VLLSRGVSKGFSMKFLFLIFLLVSPLMAGSLIPYASSHSVFQGPVPEFRFESAEFVTRIGDTIFASYNQTLIDGGTIRLEGKRINSTHVLVRVEVSGYMQYIEPGMGEGFNNTYRLDLATIVNPGIDGGGNIVVGPGFVSSVKEEISPEELERFKKLAEALETRPFRAVYEFIVDTRYNYAYIGGEPIGFFPLYSFIDIRYEEAMDLRLTYMGRPLEVSTTKNPIIGPPDDSIDKDVPIPWIIGPPGSSISTILFANEFYMANIVHNYIANINKLVLPVGDNVYLIFGTVAPTQSILQHLTVIDDDYPVSVSTESLVEEAIIVAAIAAAIVVFIYKSRRRAG